MTVAFRKLNEAGIGQFRDYLRHGANGPAPVDLLTNIETSIPLSHKIFPGTGNFEDRHTFGIYLNTLLKEFDPGTISSDAGLWDALALHWFNLLAPVQSGGERKLSKEYHYLLSSDYRHYYRHLVRSPWQLVQMHGEAAKFGSCPMTWCRFAGVATAIFRQGRVDHAAMGGSVTRGSSLNCETLSSVM